MRFSLGRVWLGFGFGWYGRVVWMERVCRNRKCWLLFGGGGCSSTTRRTIYVAHVCKLERPHVRGSCVGESGPELRMLLLVGCDPAAISRYHIAGDCLVHYRADPSPPFPRKFSVFGVCCCVGWLARSASFCDLNCVVVWGGSPRLAGENCFPAPVCWLVSPVNLCCGPLDFAGGEKGAEFWPASRGRKERAPRAVQSVGGGPPVCGDNLEYEIVLCCNPGVLLLLQSPPCS